MIRFEDLTANSEETTKKTVAFLPELESLNTSGRFKSDKKPFHTSGIRNEDGEKLRALDQDYINEVNEGLKPNQDLLKRFNYELL